MEYIIEKVLLDSKNHEAGVVCSGASFRITQADFEHLGIFEGETLDEEAFAQLCEADSKLSCIKKAFSYLSYSDMPAKKLADKLRAKFEKHIVDAVIELLKARGYLNDSLLARKYAQNFYEIKRWGPNRIKSELYAKGFAKEDIDASCAFMEELDHREKMRALVVEKFGGDAEAVSGQKQKVSAYLYRMGYSYSDITDVLNSLEN